jgi:hypothetical protein
MGCIEGRVAVEFFSEMQNKVVQQKSKLTVLLCENKYGELRLNLGFFPILFTIFSRYFFPFLLTLSNSYHITLSP